MTRPDRPPGRDAEGGPPAQGNRLHTTTTSPPPSAEVIFSVVDGTDSGRYQAPSLLDLSGERDQWERLALDWARSAYRQGYEVGHDAGYRTGYELAVRDWKITAAGMTHLGGPTYAEQDRRRYPPGGRPSWIIPRPGEDTGRHHHG